MNTTEEMKQDSPGRSQMEVDLERIVPLLGDENQAVWEAAYRQLRRTSEQCTIDGNENAWIACACYSSLVLNHQIGEPVDFRCSLTNILTVCRVSPLEFFERISRWVEMTQAPRRLSDHLLRIQQSLSVTAVVFKRFLPIFRALFTDSEKSYEVFRFIWTAYLLIKRSMLEYMSEELISSFHALLCTIDFMFNNLASIEELSMCINQDFLAEIADDEPVDMLEEMCMRFEGMVLDAKHLREHWFTPHHRDILHIDDEFVSRFDHYLHLWTKENSEKVTRRGEIDETLFIPPSICIFDPTYDEKSVDCLRSSDFDVSMANRLSTQNCLNKLRSAISNPPNCLTVNTEQFSPQPTCTMTEYTQRKLAQLISTDWDIANLERTFADSRDNPMPAVRQTANSLSQKLIAVLKEEGVGEDCEIQLAEFASRLFYRLLEKIATTERGRSANRDPQFTNIFRKDELLVSVYVCSLEIILSSVPFDRPFPWSIQIFKLAPVSFFKIIEVVIKAEPNLSREMVRRLNAIEEHVLEESAWSLDSPLWNTLARRADGVPASEHILSTDSEKRLSTQFSPVKRRREQLDRGKQQHNSASTVFFRKVYFLASARLGDLCDRLRMDEKTKQRVWTLFEHSLRTETALFAGRHIDQNLMCIVYVTGRVSKMDLSFHDIISHYRQQPQANSTVYRKVFVGSDPKVEAEYTDLITYYNKVFIDRVDKLVKKMSADGVIQLLEMPLATAQMASPARRALAEKVFVQPLTAHAPSGTRTMKYALNRSPVKDLKTINRVLKGAALARQARPAEQFSFPY